MRLIAVITATLLIAGLVNAPVAMLLSTAAAAPLEQATPEKKPAAAVPDSDYKQAAEKYRDLSVALVLALGVTATIIKSAIGAWRQVKKALREHEAAAVEAAGHVADKAVNVARDLAVTTEAQMKQVRQTVEATAQQVSADGENTLRAIVQQHGTLIEAHAEAARVFRKEITDQLQRTAEAIGRVDSNVDALTQNLMKFLTNEVTKR